VPRPDHVAHLGVIVLVARPDEAFHHHSKTDAAHHASRSAHSAAAAAWGGWASLVSRERGAATAASTE
jgi:hypothetical protein